jgi:FtsH-binding integral membrane protein
VRRSDQQVDPYLEVSLHLNFINLFLILLHLLRGRRT